MARSLRAAVVGWSASVLAAVAGLALNPVSHALAVALLLLALATTIAIPLVLLAGALDHGGPATWFLRRLSALDRLAYLPDATWTEDALPRPRLLPRDDIDAADDWPVPDWVAGWPHAQTVLALELVCDSRVQGARTATA